MSKAIIYESEAAGVMSRLKVIAQQVQGIFKEVREMGNDPALANQKKIKIEQGKVLVKKFWGLAAQNKKALTAAAITTTTLAALLYGGAKLRKYQLAKKQEEETNESIDFTYDPFITEDDTLKKVGSYVYKAARTPFERERQRVNKAFKDNKISQPQWTHKVYKNQKGWRGKLARAAGDHQKLAGGAVVAAGTVGALYGANKLRKHYLKKKEAEKQVNAKTEAKLIFYTELRDYIFENFDSIEKNKELMKEGVNRAAEKVYKFMTENISKKKS